MKIIYIIKIVDFFINNNQVNRFFLTRFSLVLSFFIIFYLLVSNLNNLLISNLYIIIILLKLI